MTVEFIIHNVGEDMEEKLVEIQPSEILSIKTLNRIRKWLGIRDFDRVVFDIENGKIVIVNVGKVEEENCEQDPLTPEMKLINNLFQPIFSSSLINEEDKGVILKIYKKYRNDLMERHPRWEKLEKREI